MWSTIQQFEQPEKMTHWIYIYIFESQRRKFLETILISTIIKAWEQCRSNDLES